MTKAMGLAAIVAVLGAGGAGAQTAEKPPARYVEVTVFGNEKCPTATRADEIVVCKRGNPDAQFRIPKELRSGANPTANRTWGQRARAVREAGASGPMSCSPVGPAGASGCWTRMMESWAESRTNSSGEGITSAPVTDD